MSAERKESESAPVNRGNAGKGRKKGVPNKVTRLLKEDILEAAAQAHPEGRVGYLRDQATKNPQAFLGLLGKVLPMQVTGEDDGPVKLTITWADE